MKSYDVIIVGAGPAGAVAGFLCAGSGLKTLIIERKHLPRQKSCGGGLTTKAISLLKQINCFEADWFEPLVNQFIIHLPKKGRAYVLAAETPCMGIVRRDLFDLALIEKSRAQGAELRTGEAFHGFRQTARQTLEVATDQSVYKTRVLIGADGCQSRVRKQMAGRFFNSPDRMPTLLGIEGDLPVEAVETVSNKFCHLFFDFAPGVSYGWVFPRGRRLNAGIVISDPAQKAFSGNTSPSRRLDEFAENILKTRSSWQRKAGGKIPLYKWGQKPLLQHGSVLLAGDAAGLADAWSGEGIYYAIKSAMLAHQAIRKTFSSSRDRLSEYQCLCCREILTDLHFSYLFHIFFKAFPRTYSGLRHDRIRRLFLPYIQGELGYPQALAKALACGLGYKLGVLSDKK